MTKEFARRPSVAGLALWKPVHKWGEMRFSVLAVSSHVLLVGKNQQGRVWSHNCAEDRKVLN